MESQSGATELSTKERKLITVIQKQDRLLYMCFYLLLNLAEDAAVERKMKRKGIVSHLLRMLERSNVELLILSVTFLKKLSIYKDNKDQMLKVCSLLYVATCSFWSVCAKACAKTGFKLPSGRMRTDHRRLLLVSAVLRKT